MWVWYPERCWTAMTSQPSTSTGATGSPTTGARRGGCPERRWGTETAAVGVIATGFAVAPVREACERLADKGIEVAGLQPRTLWPVLDETVEFVRRRPLTLVVEHNDEGQIRDVIAAAGAPLAAM